MIQPVFFISHGAPGVILNGMDKNTIKYWSNELSTTINKLSPKAVIFLSAHWFSEKNVPIINNNSKIIYDFGDFFKGIYDINYNTIPVTNDLIDPVKNTLLDYKIEKRGLDHGTWIPMKFIDPNGKIPIIQISLSCDPDKLIDIGQKLKPLREKGYLIIASGGTVHNLKHAFSNIDKVETSVPKWALDFDSQLDVLLSRDSLSPKHFYENVKKIPSYSIAHPEPHHFLPILVAISASDKFKAKKIHSGWVHSSLSMSIYEFL